MPSHWSIRQKNCTLRACEPRKPRDVTPTLPTENWPDHLGKVYCETDSHGTHGFGGVSARGGVVMSTSGGGYVSLLPSWDRSKKKGKTPKLSAAMKSRLRALKKRNLKATDLETVLVQLGSNDCETAAQARELPGRRMAHTTPGSGPAPSV